MSAKDEKPLKVTVSILCGPERTHWINPQLAFWLVNGAGRRKNLHLGILPMYGFVPIDHARNRVVEFFLKGDSEWLCMIDNDIAPAPNLMEILDDLGDHVRIVAPMTVMWSGKHHAPMLTGATEQEDYFIPLSQPRRGKNEVSAVGTGCIFIHRDVFLKLGKPYFEFQYDPETRGYVYGEDYLFCKRARAAGFKIFADSRFICGHFHTLDLTEVNFGWAQMLEAAKKQEKVELATEGEMKQAISDAKMLEKLK